MGKPVKKKKKSVDVNYGPIWYMEPIVCPECGNKSKELYDSPSSWQGYCDPEPFTVKEKCLKCSTVTEYLFPKYCRIIGGN